MTPTRTILARVMALLIADDSWLRNDGEYHRMYPITADFTPTDDLAIGDITYSDAGISGGFAEIGDDWQSAIDPQSGDYVMSHRPTWNYNLVKADGSPLPFVIYGWAVITNQEDGLRAYEKLTDEVTFNAAGEGVISPDMTVRFPIAAWR